MTLKYAFKFAFFLFCIVTTFQTIFIGIVSAVFDMDFSLQGMGILTVPFIGFASVLPTFLLVRSENKAPPSRIETIVRTALHFILTMGIVFGLLIYFEWLDTANALVTGLFFLIIYAGAYTFQELRDRKLANKLNEKIIAYNKAGDTITRRADDRA